jgi:hypothetical protein
VKDMRQKYEKVLSDVYLFWNGRSVCFFLYFGGIIL